jgi:tRNA (guanosine-2'-O-)-methyltransferase
MVRTCDAVGIGNIHAVLSSDELRPFRGTAMGSNQWVDIKIHPDIDHAIDDVKQQKMQLLVADIKTDDQGSCAFDQVDFTRPTALLMGSENKGVSDIGRQQADLLVHIPMMGMVESYNVSVAAAIILNEARAQRIKAGLYQSRQISEAEQQKLFFQWGYPRLAKFCDLRGIRYPSLDSNGDIDDPKGIWRAEAKSLEVLAEGSD